MAIDPMMLDPMLGTFRTMMAEIEEKGINTENAQNMKECLERMESLGQEKSDFNEFNAILMNENLFGRFSDSYGKALAEEAAQAQGQKGNNGYDDSALLKQTQDALRNAIKRLKEGKAEALAETNRSDQEEQAQQAEEFVTRNLQQFGLEEVDKRVLGSVLKEYKKETASDSRQNPQKFSNAVEIEAMCQNHTLIEAIEDVIRLGDEPGMTFPRYLRLQIERGLDKAMEGSVLMRNGMDFEQGFIVANGNQPYHLAEVNERMEAYDKMAASAPFGVPNQLEYQFVRSSIERRFWPQQKKYSLITKKWERILDHLDTWIKAHSKYVDYIEPWRFMKQPEKQKSIERAKECSPGIMKVVEEIFHNYFGLNFNDIWGHETFVNFVNAEYMYDSQQYVTFLRDVVYPECVPFQKPNQDTISEWERLYEEKLLINPNVNTPTERMKKHYDHLFGEGRYQIKFGDIPPPPETNASPWDLSTF